MQLNNSKALIYARTKKWQITLHNQALKQMQSGATSRYTFDFT